MSNMKSEVVVVSTGIGFPLVTDSEAHYLQYKSSSNPDYIPWGLSSTREDKFLAKRRDGLPCSSVSSFVPTGVQSVGRK